MLEVVYFDNNNVDGIIDLVGNYAVKKKNYSNVSKQCR